ncbi:diacylglycerol kinase [Rhodobacter calidifons]|uniref:Diacylglycerol kinase n=1 Tax=Rhodobacter calidifons TaxID=2715277 RepID=A0ABX0G4Y1_9RHOB|nr:diacylglycerol kinase [Rhodobacter calidifons]NHB76254.1 diacylglycerol kinase [Rhodobacter calidifons]
MAVEEKPPRKTGPAHFLAAAGYSLAGLRRLARESAFRQEILLILGLLVVFLVFGASLAEIGGLLALGLVLIAVEALNTALEVLVDHLSPGWSQFARDAKDLGSLAVACVIGAIVLFAGIVLI